MEKRMVETEWLEEIRLTPFKEDYTEVYFASEVDARIAELEGWLDRLLPSWREAEARDYEEALVTSYRHQIAELENALRERARVTFRTTLPTEPGLYRHRWDFKGEMREQTLFVGYTNASAPKLQGTEPNGYMPRKLKCCPPDEHLHADRLTPAEWGGWWERAEKETRAEDDPDPGRVCSAARRRD